MKARCTRRSAIIAARARQVAWFALVLAFFASLAFAQTAKPETPIVFRDTREESRFHALATSLRCVMCQNQSLADSEALIARDLRREIITRMREGRSDAQIRAFLVARYGEFVLYQPRVEPATWLLWFGPLALFVAGGATVLFIVRQRSRRLRSPASATAQADAPESTEEW